MERMIVVKRIFAAGLCLCMMLALFAGCGAQTSAPAAAAPAAEPPVRTAERVQAAQTQTTQSQDGVIRVSDVDAFLDAIAPGAVIELAPGTYDLTQASTYGRPTGSLYYRWADTYDGFSLQIVDVPDLTIRGSGADTQLVTQPRGAAVLSLEGCAGLHLENFTAGHTVTGEACGSSVIQLQACTHSFLEDLRVFGCGAIGVHTLSCQGITIRDCDIYECSDKGLVAWDVQVLSVENTSFRSLGYRDGGMMVFDLFDSHSVRIADCTVTDCTATYLMYSDSCTDVVLEKNKISDSAFTYAFSILGGEPPMSTGNVFEALNLTAWYENEQTLTDEAGETLSADKLEKAHERFVRETRQEIGNVEVRPVSTRKQEVWRVATAEEFLQAIGPDREIILEAGQLFLEDVHDYAIGRTEWYYWDGQYDGPELVIRNVENMTIRAASDERKAHVISAVPRYANVLTFENCSAITLQGFTAGHTLEPGYCRGGVLAFRECRDVLVDHCGLFGCGILGVDASDTGGLQVKNCEIYECSDGGIQLYSCEDVEIGGCAFWDLGGAVYSFSRCQSVTVDGDAMKGNYNGD